MLVPNHQYNSGKQPKGKRKPRLIQQSKQKLKAYKLKYQMIQSRVSTH